MNLTHKEREVHERALLASQTYKRAEARLIHALQEADSCRVYLKFRKKSVLDYAEDVLKLSRSVALNFIVVARKAIEVPALLNLIEEEKVTLSNARKITSVLTKENQDRWLELAVSLPQQKLEKEVARENPKEAVPERVKYVSGERLELKMGISERFQEKMKRIRDLESRKHQAAKSLEESMEAAMDAYLEKNDPVLQAKRIVKKRKQLSVLRHMDLRDGDQCTHISEKGERCPERRWLHVHHIVPKSEGGGDTLENLTTLCSGHHRLVHEPH